MTMHGTTKAHLGWFAIKLVVAAAIAGIVRHENYLLSFSVWVFAYAVLAASSAVIRGECYTRDRSGYWDEALWLGATACVLQAASRLV